MPDSLFMIHGMWGGPWCWDNFRKVFQESGYRCVAPTLQFHDMAPEEVPDPRLGTTSLLDYAADLERAIRDLDGPPVLMGHSMGGLLAQILASRGLARALVLLTPAPPSGIMALSRSGIKSLWSVMSRWGFWKKPMRPNYDEAVYAMLHLLSPDERRNTYARFVYESGRAGWEIGFWPLDACRASRVDASRVACPLLVVGASQDRIMPAAVVRRVAAKYGSVASYKEFDDHAHWVLGEPGWQAVAAHAAAWLQQALEG